MGRGLEFFSFSQYVPFTRTGALMRMPDETLEGGGRA